MRAAVHLEQFAQSPTPLPPLAMHLDLADVGDQPGGLEPPPAGGARHRQVFPGQKFRGMRRRESPVPGPVRRQHLGLQFTVGGVARPPTQTMNQSAIPLLQIAVPEPLRLPLREPEQSPGLRHADRPFLDLAEYRQPPPFRHAHRKCFHPAGLSQTA